MSKKHLKKEIRSKNRHDMKNNPFKENCRYYSFGFLVSDY